MKIIVTGGAGFIGSHVVDKLVTEGHQVMILDDFSAGSKKFVHPKARVARTDIRNARRVDAAFASFGPKAVFHLAAHIDLRESLKDPVYDYEVNVLGSVNLLEACRKHHVRQFIFSSSAAVYGENSRVPLKEQEMIRAVSPYGAAKAAIEHYLETYSAQFGIQSTVLRYANVYGPRQGNVGEGGVIAIFCKQLAEGKQLRIFGSGKQTRDFVFVEDVVASNVRALASRRPFAVYNVSTKKETSVSHLAQELSRISNQRVRITHTRAVKCEVMRNSLDNSKIQKDLKWKSRTSLSAGLRKTWEWFRDEY